MSRRQCDDGYGRDSRPRCTREPYGARPARRDREHDGLLQRRIDDLLKGLPFAGESGDLLEAGAGSDFVGVLPGGDRAVAVAELQEEQTSHQRCLLVAGVALERPAQCIEGCVGLAHCQPDDARDVVAVGVLRVDLQDALGLLERIEGPAVRQQELGQRTVQVDVRRLGFDLAPEFLGPPGRLGIERGLTAEIGSAAGLLIGHLLGLGIGLGVGLGPDHEGGDQTDHTAAEQGAGEQGMSLDEGPASRLRGLRSGAALRADPGDRLLDLVELPKHPGRRDLKPAAVGRFDPGLGQPAKQLLAPAQKIRALKLERGRARRGFRWQEREPDSQAGKDGNSQCDRRDNSQSVVSCFTCCR